MAVQDQFPFGWNSYLLFRSDIVNLVWKTKGGGRKHYFVDFCFLKFQGNVSG